MAKLPFPRKWHLHKFPSNLVEEINSPKFELSRNDLFFNSVSPIFVFPSGSWELLNLTTNVSKLERDIFTDFVRSGSHYLSEKRQGSKIQCLSSHELDHKELTKYHFSTLRSAAFQLLVVL